MSVETRLCRALDRAWARGVVPDKVFISASARDKLLREQRSEAVVAARRKSVHVPDGRFEFAYDKHVTKIEVDPQLSGERIRLE